MNEITVEILSDVRFSIVTILSNKRKLITFNHENKSYVIMTMYYYNKNYDLFTELSGYVDVDDLAIMEKLGFITNRDEIANVKKTLDENNFPSMDYLYELINPYCIELKKSLDKPN